MVAEIDFVPASELKKRYAVYGHFYDAEPKPGLIVKCRSALEIFSKKRAHAFSSARRGLPDSVLVMMNPGSSRPLADSSVGVSDIPLIDKTFVLTKPDTTQYQAMRLMDVMEWEHVRVINLSDLREAKSALFAAAYRSLEREHDFTHHSIFSAARRGELGAELRRKPNAPLLCAWGVSASLNPLITNALRVLTNSGMPVGLIKPGTSDKYRHPLPTLHRDKVAWFNEMRDLLLSRR